MRVKFWGAALLVVAGAAAVFLFARGRPPSGPAPGSLRNASVLLITIDTLRADRLGSYGGHVPTPALDALAKRGRRFVHAYSHAPMTLPSHASILTGLTPPGHGVRNNGSFTLSDTHQTIAQLLKAEGYRTGAFVGSFVLDARFGLARGFDVYDDFYGEERGRLDFGFVQRRAADVLRPAEDWILQNAPVAAGPRPYFAWIHLFDPHTPYDAPTRYVDNPYDNEIAYTDAQLASFFQRLDGAGALDRTLIIVTADHGEALGDHGEATHGLFAYDSTLRVPLIIAGPGLQPETSDRWVSHADIVPTILDLLGVKGPSELHGRSLLASGQHDDRPIYFEALDANLTRNWAPLTGLIAGGWKYVELPIPELYDLETDPGETQNRASEDRRRAGAIESRLKEVSQALSHGKASSAPPPDADAAARLRALGYTSSALPAGARKATFTERDDPKRLVDLNAAYTHALEVAGAGSHAEAIAALEGLIAQRPDFASAYTTLAAVLIEMGRPADAVARLDAARRRGLDTPDITERLGSALLAAGQFDRVIAVLEPLANAPATPPGAQDFPPALSLDAQNTLAVAYAQSGRLDDARRLFQRVTAVDPSAAGTWNNIGLLELQAGRPNMAAAAFRRAVELDPGYGPAWEGLGAALVNHDRAQAVAAWTRAVEVMPDAFDTLFNVGMLLANSSDPKRAIPYLQRFADTAPPDRYARDIERVKVVITKIEKG